MTKIDAELKEAILKDKSSMKTKQLQEKYGLSRSSIQRIKLPDLESRIKEFQKPQDESQAAAIVEQLIRPNNPLLPHVKIPFSVTSNKTGEE